MDMDKVLQELKQQRELLEEVILCFERLKRGGRRRRGRPPRWHKQAQARLEQRNSDTETKVRE